MHIRKIMHNNLCVFKGQMSGFVENFNIGIYSDMVPLTGF